MSEQLDQVTALSGAIVGSQQQKQSKHLHHGRGIYQRSWATAKPVGVIATVASPPKMSLR